MKKNRNDLYATGEQQKQTTPLHKANKPTPTPKMNTFSNENKVPISAASNILGGKLHLNFGRPAHPQDAKAALLSDRSNQDKKMLDAKVPNAAAIIKRPVSYRAPLGAINSNMVGAAMPAPAQQQPIMKKPVLQVTVPQNPLVPQQQQQHMQQSGVVTPIRVSQISAPSAKISPRSLKEATSALNALKSLPNPQGPLNKHEYASKEVEPFDCDMDSQDPRQASEFIEDIFGHLRANEMRYAASPSYMDRQTDINSTMRTVLIDWIIDAHHKFQLLPETFYLTVNLIDRFLDVKHTSRSKLQLIGVTALMLSSKYEEIFSPELSEFVKIGAGAYTSDEVLKMEKFMLACLNFNLTVPTPFVFLKRYLQFAEAPVKLQFVTNYLAELSQLEYKMLKYQPSLIACSCIYLANQLLGEASDECWNEEMQQITGYDEVALVNCAKNLARLLERDSDPKNNKYVAIRKKYSSKRRLELSKYMPYLIKLPQVREFLA